MRWRHTVSNCRKVNLPRFYRHLHQGENHDIGGHLGRNTVPSGLYQGHGTVWNLSCTGWRLSGDLPMRVRGSLSLTVTFPNEQCIEVPEADVRWSRGQEFAVKNHVIKPQTNARLQHYVKRLAQEPTEILS